MIIDVKTVGNTIYVVATIDGESGDEATLIRQILQSKTQLRRYNYSDIVNGTVTDTPVGITRIEFELKEKLRRFKAITIDQQCILQMFRNSNPVYDVIVLNKYDETIPEDAIVESVMYDFSRQAFMLVISHPTFPHVAVGTMIPYHELYIGNIVYERQQYGIDPNGDVLLITNDNKQDLIPIDYTPKDAQ